MALQSFEIVEKDDYLEEENVLIEIEAFGYIEHTFLRSLI